MPRIGTIYLTADGRYRIRESLTTPMFPLLALNARDRQAHTLLGAPTFVKDPPRVCDSLEDLMNAPPPLTASGQSMMLCEDNNFYPVSLSPLPMEAHWYHQSALFEESLQAATDGATQDEHSAPLGRLAFLVILGVVSVLTFVLGFMLIALLLSGDVGSVA